MTMGLLQLGPSAFDELAGNYDASFTTTLLGRWLRSVVWERMDICFAGRRRILDIGCGTGEDALRLATMGHEVLAIDASQAMLDVAAEKARFAGPGRIEFRCIAMEQLGSVLEGEQFDGVVSNFGVINCASAPQRLVAEVAKLLKTGAPFVWVVMGRHVPWEWIWFLARLDFRTAFRRLNKHGVAWRGMTVRYPTPRELARTVKPYFASVRRFPLGVVLPPGYASGWLERRPGVFAAFSGIERLARRYQGLAALADHYIIEGQRAATDG